jgi:SAM-dependent methyltransferase
VREHYIHGGPSVDLYDARMTHVLPPIRGDVAFYPRWARKAGGPVLELGCGTGRVSIPLARAGFDVTGLDLSPHMLAVARGKWIRLAGSRPPAHPQLPGAVRWVEGDMERFDLERRFRLIIIPFRAFQHLMTPEAQRRCLACVRRHLARDGRFIVHLFDPRLEFCLPQKHRAPKGRARVRDPRTGRWWAVEVTGRRNDPFTQVLSETWAWRDGRRVWREILQLRWTYRHEMEYLLRLSGLEPVACCGDFRGGRPRYGAEQIWICKRGAVPPAPRPSRARTPEIFECGRATTGSSSASNPAGSSS